MRRRFRTRSIAAATASASLSALLAGWTLWPAASDGQVLPPPLEEVLVSAQRRDETLLGIASAVTVVDSSRLRVTGARTLEEAAESVAGFSLEKIQGYNNAVIRGVGGGGRNIGFETRTGVYVDDVYVGQPQALGLPLYDIERVEVLRGPQGYLFGRNSVSGAVNIVTRAPARESERTFRAMLGNAGLSEIEGRVNAPLGERAAGSLAVLWTARDGFARNLAGGELDDLDRKSARGRLRFTPAEATTVDWHADVADVRQATVVTGAPATDFFDTPNPRLPLPPRTFEIDTPSFENVRARGTNVTLRHVLPGGAVATAVTGLRVTRQTRQNDTDYSRADLLWVRYAERYRQWSQEIRITSANRGRVRYLAGLLLLDEIAHSDRRAVVGADTGTVVPLPGGISAPFGPALAVEPGGGATIASRVRTRAFGFFGGFDYSAGPRLTASLGARYTRETKSLRHDLDGSASGAFDIGVVPGFGDRRSAAEWTPSIGLRYALTERVNAFATYRSGFKSGGWNLDFLTDAQVDAGYAFDDETAHAYELGLKADFSALSIDLSIFRADYRDHQVFQSLRTGGGQTVLVLTNAARARVEGVDASVFARPTERLAVVAGIELLDARYRAFPDGGGPGVDLDGNRLQAAPRASGSLMLDYLVPTLRGELTLHARYSGRGSTYMQPTNRPLDRLEPRALLDVRTTWRPAAAPAWALSLWARNLLDENYLNRRGRDFLGNQYLKLGDPRTYGIEVSYGL